MEKNIKDNEVVLGDKKIGPETIIQINLKTMIIVLSFIVSTAITAWWNLKGIIDKSNLKSAEDIKELSKEIKSIKEQDLKTISIQLNQVDGKVQGIFMNMQRNSQIRNENINGITPETTLTPSNPNR